jgi:hypothetical protein
MYSVPADQSTFTFRLFQEDCVLFSYFIRLIGANDFLNYLGMTVVKTENTLVVYLYFHFCQLTWQLRRFLSFDKTELI